MLWKTNAVRTVLALAILVVGVGWVAHSAISHYGIGDLVAEASMDPRVVGSGHLVDQVRDIGDVDSIELQGSYDAVISIGSPASLQISADDNLFPSIASDVEDGNLVISTKGSITTEHRIKVAITVPSLHALHINSGTVTIAGLGGGDLKVGVEGSADVKASGRVEALDARVEGSGKLQFADLEANSVTVEIEGSGKAAVKAIESLDVSIEGSGAVVYSGSPKHLDKDIEGSGSIEPAA